MFIVKPVFFYRHYRISIFSFLVAWDFNVIFGICGTNPGNSRKEEWSHWLGPLRELVVQK